MCWSFEEWPALKRLQKTIVFCGYKKSTRSGAIWRKARVGFEMSAKNERFFVSELAKLWDIGARDGVATIRENRLLTVKDREEDIAFYADQQGMQEAMMSGKDKIFLQRSCFCCSAVVVAHIYPPVMGQRQTPTHWTIRTLFITRTTSGLQESAPA